MKTLTLRYENEEFILIQNKKNRSGLSWEKYILQLVMKGGENGKNKHN